MLVGSLYARSSTLKLYARWTVFTTPLVRTISLHDEKMGRLHGCILCVSQDGTIAVVAVDGFQLYVTSTQLVDFAYPYPAYTSCLRPLHPSSGYV